MSQYGLINIPTEIRHHFIQTSWLTNHLQPSCPPEGDTLNIFLKQNMKTFRTVSRSLVHAFLYC